MNQIAFLSTARHNVFVMATQKIMIDAAKCTGCGECVADCPNSVLAVAEEGKIIVAKPETCIQCCHCAAVCPVDAVTLPAYDPGNFPLLQAEPLIGYNDLISLLRRRRSIRRYIHETVPREVVEQLIEAARYAPTGSNSQGCRYIVVEGFDAVRSISGTMINYYVGLAKMMNTPWGRVALRLAIGGKAYPGFKRYLPFIWDSTKKYDAGGDPVFRGAPLLIGIYIGPGSFTAHDDCIIAMCHMLMAAETLGLGSCLNGFLTISAARSKDIRDAMGVPEDHKLYAAAAFGYPDVKYRRAVDRFKPDIAWLER